MKISIDKDNNIIAYASVGDIDNSFTVEDYIFNKDIQDKNGYYNYSYLNGKIVKNDNSNKLNLYEINLQISQLKAYLDSTDYKVLRNTREKALNISTTLSEDEYLQLENDRQAAVEKIRELEKKLGV